MLRGKEIPYKDEGRDVLLDALLSPVQATIARHETQAEYHETEPKPSEQSYHSYANFPPITGSSSEGLKAPAPALLHGPHHTPLELRGNAD
jgi:hypothetical protein